MLLLIIPSRLSHDQQQDHDDNLHHYRKQHHHYHYHCLLLILLLLLLPLLHSSSASTSKLCSYYLLMSTTIYHLLSSAVRYLPSATATTTTARIPQKPVVPCGRTPALVGGETLLRKKSLVALCRTPKTGRPRAQTLLLVMRCETSAGSHCDALLVLCSWLLHLASCGHPVLSEVIPMDSDTVTATGQATKTTPPAGQTGARLAWHMVRYYNIILYYTILYYTILYHIILYYSILYHIIVYYTAHSCRRFRFWSLALDSTKGKQQPSEASEATGMLIPKP